MTPKRPRPTDVRHYHVFLASPGDMDAERRAVRAFFQDFNRRQARHWHVQFDVIDWESYSTAGVGRPQELINRATLERFQDSLALVVGLMGQRFGSPTGKAESGTEEEFELALEHRRANGFPEVKWFFRKIEHLTLPADPQELAAAVEQWEKVCAFRKRLEDGEPALLYRGFDPDRFAEDLRDDLENWLCDRERPWHGRAGDGEPQEDEPPPATLEAIPEPDPRLTTYLSWAGERHGGLSLIGVGGGEVRMDLAEVYVPLRLRELDAELHHDGRGGRPKRRPAGDGNLELDEIFHTASAHALIVGEPGSGKTTALRKLHQRCLEAGGPAALGLDAGTVPIFLRLRSLREGDLGGSAAGFIEAELRALSGGTLDAGLGEALWRRGRLLLLLDGLDELADEALRERVCGFLERELAGAERRGVRAVVSCRTAAARHLTLGEPFLTFDVHPLDAEQVRSLVRRWFREVGKALPRHSPEELLETADGLIAALDGADYSAQQIKVLVSTPLLLTLLCVVVLRGGEMPRHRVQFYDQCLRVLLGSWQAERGAEPLLEVDTALAVLRTLAWELHAARRRDDLLTAELVDHLERRLGQLEQPVSAFDVCKWLHREAGVITEYAPQRWGFFHLGVQEYLSALEAASRGEEALDELCAHFGDDWWREVTLLMLGLPGRSVFVPFLERLLASGALIEQADRLRECLDEAQEVDLEPFLPYLEPGIEPPRQAAVLRLLRGRSEPRLQRLAAALAASGEGEVGVLAAQVAGAGGREVASAATFDLFLAHHPADAEAVAQLAGRLRQRGMRLLEVAQDGSALEQILESTRGVALVAGPSGEPAWEHDEVRALLPLLDRRGSAVLPLLVEGCVGEPSWPAQRGLCRPVDLRRGLDLAAIEEALVAGDRPASEPAVGRTFVEPVSGILFLWVPGERFQMGGTAYDDEKPIHWVRLSPYWLGETPVTNAQYSLFLRASEHPEPEYWRHRDFSAPEQPVVGVNWHDARQYCRWLTASSGHEVDLPTEAQWELAARGTDGREYPWGSQPPDVERANFNENVEKPTPVGAYPSGAGPYGHLDLAGNVWEWCRDGWDDEAYAKRQGEVIDPFVPGGAGEEAPKVLRGGSWFYGAVYLRSACRNGNHARIRYGGCGFRVCCAAPPSLEAS